MAEFQSPAPSLTSVINGLIWTDLTSKESPVWPPPDCARGTGTTAQVSADLFDKVEQRRGAMPPMKYIEGLVHAYLARREALRAAAMLEVKPAEAAPEAKATEATPAQVVEKPRASTLTRTEREQREEVIYVDYVVEALKAEASGRLTAARISQAIRAGVARDNPHLKPMAAVHTTTIGRMLTAGITKGVLAGSLTAGVTLVPAKEAPPVDAAPAPVEQPSAVQAAPEPSPVENPIIQRQAKAMATLRAELQAAEERAALAVLTAGVATDTVKDLQAKLAACKDPVAIFAEGPIKSPSDGDSPEIVWEAVGNWERRAILGKYAAAITMPLTGRLLLSVYNMSQPVPRESVFGGWCFHIGQALVLGATALRNFDSINPERPFALASERPAAPVVP
jgi:hypothetical protein